MGKNARSIAVIGCGWLGIPFCRKMIERGWTVYGTTTNKAKFPVLKNFGIRPFLLNLPSKTELNSNLFKVDYLLINYQAQNGCPGEKTNTGGQPESSCSDRESQQVIGLAHKATEPLGRDRPGCDEHGRPKVRQSKEQDD